MSRDLIEVLRQWADDPMWADHAEVPKIVLRKAADRIAALEAEASEGERMRALLAGQPELASASANQLSGSEVGEPADWQPIETAPRDGTEIILHDRGTVGTGFYSDAPEARRAEAGWFWEDDRGNLVIAKNADPTHWRPLPPPPSQDREPDSQRGAK